MRSYQSADFSQEVPPRLRSPRGGPPGRPPGRGPPRGGVREPTGLRGRSGAGMRPHVSPQCRPGATGKAGGRASCLRVSGWEGKGFRAKVSHGGHGAHGVGGTNGGLGTPCPPRPPCEPWIEEPGRCLSRSRTATLQQHAVEDPAIQETKGRSLYRASTTAGFRRPQPSESAALSAFATSDSLFFFEVFEDARSMSDGSF